MYTRNFGKQKYTPPPGYDGNAFSGSPETKMHEPLHLIRDERAEELSEPAEVSVAEIHEPALEAEAIKENEHHKKESELGTLLNRLKGRMGREELMLLLVMLLIAEDGLCAEELILGLLLFA